MPRSSSRRHATTALLGLAAFALGLGVARGTGAPPEGSAPPQSAPPEAFYEPASPDGAAAAAPRREQALPPPVRRTATEVFQAAGRVAALKAALAELDPTEEPWPDLVPDDLQPAVFEAHVRSALEAVGRGDLQAMDCDEYPCVATLALPDPAPDTTAAERLAELMEVRAELENYLGMPIDAHMDVHGGGTWLTLGAHPDGIGGSRIRQRLEAAWTDASR